MRYSGIHKNDRERMLATIGVDSVDDLFASVPEAARMTRALEIEGPLPEATLLKRLETLESPAPRVSLIGTGLYDHFIPRTVDNLVARSEWVTSYTPYQPELAQGTLTMYYEFQTYVCMLTGQEIANGGMYDGSTALAEAVLMAKRIRKKATKLYVTDALHPHYAEVLETYLNFQDGIEYVTLPVDPETGRTKLELSEEEQKDALAIVLQTPNMFGVLEDRSALSDDTFVIAVTTEAQSLALVTPMQADISVGEMQSLGIPMQLGGPTAGFFACKRAYVRQLPGRLVGKTLDKHGQPAFCITLATREQFIRREKATSNICTASGLMCLRSAVYLSLMGREGLQTVARQSAQATRAFVAGIAKAGIKPAFPESPVFNEIVLDLSTHPKLYEALKDRDFLLGLPIDEWFPQYKNHVVVCLTEKHYPMVDELVKEVLDCANNS